MLVLNGANLLRQTVGGAAKIDPTWDAIRCNSAEHAAAAKLVLGDDDKLN